MIPHPRRGFTLIEIAIVMVIIGLIIAGIFVGRDMIAAAKFRKVHKQQEEISSAVQTFRGKYNCLPGDCENATQWFGDHGDCPDLTAASTAAPAFYTNVTPVITTCNGDGDRRIDAGVTLYESTTLWQHLGNAGLIGGIYSGGVDYSGDGVIAGTNMPRVTALPDMFGWIPMDGDNFSLLVMVAISPPVMALVPARHYGTLLVIAANGTTPAAPFTPIEAYAFDQKFDDGSPVTGRIIQTNGVGTAAHCTDAADDTIADAGNSTAQYLIHDATYQNQPTCTAAYVTGW